ncbi:MAG: DUF6231 family protein [Gammaproteobacteria bacterium]|nr:DUF6231 family protein [Gammaproteobacteria bacterium]
MTLTLSEDARSDLQELISSVKPESVLLAGGAHEYGDLVDESAAQCQVKPIDVAGLCSTIDQLPVFDVILLADVLEYLDKSAAEALIGRLRDLHSRHLFLFIRIGDDWPDIQSRWRRNDLLAHGFCLYRRYDKDGHEYHLYRFELETYKATPEWLNSQYWANPELFDKYRW